MNTDDYADVLVNLAERVVRAEEKTQQLTRKQWDSIFTMITHFGEEGIISAKVRCIKIHRIIEQGSSLRKSKEFVESFGI